MLKYNHNNLNKTNVKQAPKIPVETSVMIVLITVIVCLISSLIFVTIYQP